MKGPIHTMSDRSQQLLRWLAQTLSTDSPSVQPVSGDASFRRYFRTQHQGKSLIIMDAPPDKEDCTSFIAIAQHWREHGVQVPQLLAIDQTQGFLLLSDFGDQVLLSALRAADGTPNIEAGDRHYRTALDALLHIQQVPGSESRLPPYDHALLLREMALFRDWLSVQHLGLTPDENIFAETFEALAQAALSQPKVTVHRDYHSRNLMLLADHSLGIIDFQDAVFGPLTYDLVSLLRDCYIVWPEALVNAWAEQYFHASRENGLHAADLATFMRWFDLMGVQRHLKASGIFARLSIRDGKHGYLDSIPDTVNYLRRVMPRYAETRALANWIEQHMVPALGLSKLS
jgi:aminoglycoside/choline kinase family phosphotransferase